MSLLREIDRWFIDEVLPHEARYLALARRMTGNRDQAADLVHDAYTRLFRDEAWRAIDHPSAYVLRMVRNLAIQRMRRTKIVSFASIANLDELEQAVPAPDPFDRMVARHELRRLANAIRELPARCRDVMLLRRFEELPPREVAERLGLSLSTMEKRLARALVLLTKALQQEPTSSAQAPGSPARRKRS
ncbi:RNA polymerase sigma factor [Steroidobacter sp. S1-65]|uniref:RNA polymerase sigma factor n=1 Tax=Steroidobacter gossypii TaxID=2805490 RepID=A0ABS1X2P2_9GAMM|nr:RNA polymerase sigma factor [Steroidobacter gossypii]